MGTRENRVNKIVSIVMIVVIAVLGLPLWLWATELAGVIGFFLAAVVLAAAEWSMALTLWDTRVTNAPSKVEEYARS